MGAVCSSTNELHSSLVAGSADAIRKDLGVSLLEAAALLRSFDKFDSAGERDGFIKKTEFAAAVNGAIPVPLDLARSPVFKRVFNVFDIDGSADIDFREMVATTWVHLTCCPMSLIKLAHTLYDRDDSGTLEIREINEVLRLIVDTAAKAGAGTLPLAKLLAPTVPSAGSDSKLKSKDSARKRSGVGQGFIGGAKPATLDGSVFTSFALAHPGILFPAARVQEHLRQVIAGPEFWVNVTRSRLSPVAWRVCEEFLRSVRADMATQQFADAIEATRTAAPMASQLATRAEVEAAQAMHNVVCGVLAGGRAPKNDLMLNTVAYRSMLTPARAVPSQQGRNRSAGKLRQAYLDMKAEEGDTEAPSKRSQAPESRPNRPTAQTSGVPPLGSGSRARVAPATSDPAPASGRKSNVTPRHASDGAGDPGAGARTTPRSGGSTGRMPLAAKGSANSIVPRVPSNRVAPLQPSGGSEYTGFDESEDRPRKRSTVGAGNASGIAVNRRL